MWVHSSKYEIPLMKSQILDTYLAASCATKINIEIVSCWFPCILIMNITHRSEHAS